MSPTPPTFPANLLQDSLLLCIQCPREIELIYGRHLRGFILYRVTTLLSLSVLALVVNARTNTAASNRDYSMHALTRFCRIRIAHIHFICFTKGTMQTFGTVRFYYHLGPLRLHSTTMFYSRKKDLPVTLHDRHWTALYRAALYKFIL